MTLASYTVPTPIPAPYTNSVLFRDATVQTNLEMRFVQLVRLAHSQGFEVTITQHPSQPLRMGNKVTRIELTPHSKPAP